MPELYFGDAFKGGGGVGEMEQEPQDGGVMDLPQWRRLRNAMDWSRHRMLPYRKNRYKFIRQYVGFRYSNDGMTDKVPVNLMEMAINVYVRSLAADIPKVLVGTTKGELKPQAYELELALGVLMERIGFGDTLHRVVRDALFSVGIIKTGLAFAESTNIFEIRTDISQPFAEVVDLDDWVHDMSARHWDEMAFCGNRYRLPTEYVKTSPLFDHSSTRYLGPTYKSNYNEFGDSKLETIGRGVEGDRDEYQEYTEMWDVWVPADNIVVTFLADDEGGPNGPPVRIVEWQGPREGPYHILTFNEVPNNVMPLSPAALWYDLSDLYIRLYNKLGRQAERQKTILGVQAAATEDGERIIRTEDGQAIRVDNPDRAREYTFGGPSQENLAFSTHSKNLFSWVTGNLDMLAGLGPSSDTVGQDEMISVGSGRRMSAMQERTSVFVEGVCKALGEYLWNDPLIELPLIKQANGSSVRAMWTPEMRDGDLMDYNIKIEPYSMQHRSPEMRLSHINQVMQSYIIPLMPMMQEQGIMVNFDGLMRTIAKYTSMYELEDLLMFDTRTQRGARDNQVEPRQSPTTHRVNERINRPGATTQGKDQSLISMLMAPQGKVGVQGAERASVMRPTG